MQGRVQKWVDHFISVTLNLPPMLMKNSVNRLLYRSVRRSQAVRAARYTAVNHVREACIIGKESARTIHAQPMVIAHKFNNELEADVVRSRATREK